MRLLLELDKKDYEGYYKKYKREAARAIIYKNNKLLLVKGENQGFYKFPGGGLHFAELRKIALVRETKEETGYKIKFCSIKDFGYAKECKKSNKYKEAIFMHYSYYYFADIYDNKGKQHLDPYEKELGLKSDFVDIDYAIKVNNQFLKDNDKSEYEYIVRETRILEILKDYYNRGI